VDPAAIAMIARKVLSMLFDENDRQLLAKIAIGVLGVLLLVALLFAAPFLMYQKVPLVSMRVADMYVNAAQAVEQSTQSPADPQGVPVNWQQVLAVDAVRYNQDFSQVAPSDAYQTAKLFIRQTGTRSVTTGSGSSATTVIYPVYQAVGLQDVCGELGISYDKVEQYLSVDLSFLLGDDSVADEGGRIYTAPAALKYQAVDSDAVITYLGNYNSALANRADVQIIIQAAQAHGVNPLLLFAVTGQEQCFDDENNDNAADVAAIADNPFNVGGSWQTTDYTLAQSADIAANFLAERLSQAPPSGENAVEWINDPANPNGGLYASEPDGSPTPGWWEGVNCFFQEMNSLPGVYTQSAQGGNSQ
jgi:hypothetical protein